jgi:hypothetical protein
MLYEGVLRYAIRFLFRLPFARWWKNLVHASPSLIWTKRELCRRRDLSMAAYPSTWYFRSLSNCASDSESVLVSCAISRCRIASFATCNCILASLNKSLLQAFKCLVVIRRRLCSLINGLFPSTGRAQASVTASLNPGILVQNCSNLKVASLGWACWLHRKSGQWSDSELNTAWRPISGNMADQSWLQNTRSKCTNVGTVRPLLSLSSNKSLASSALLNKEKNSGL